MKRTLLVSFLIVFLITQISSQTDGIQAAVEAAQTATTYRPQVAYLPVMKMTAKEVKAYAINPKNKPKLDFKPIGQAYTQPKTAGAVNTKMASQVIGGTKAVQGQFPWQVYIITDGTSICGGSIISTSWVLTAAHCVVGGGSFQVVAGGVDRTVTESGEVSQTTNCAMPHANYDVNTKNNDIALIKMPTAWVLSTFINVVRLPKLSQATTTFANSTAIVSGYGRTSSNSTPSIFLNSVPLTVISNTQCASVYGGSMVISSTICTGADPTKSSCKGDSGGPLVVKESDGQFTQIGVVSFVAYINGQVVCNGYPSGYTRVSSFLGWISASTGIAISP